MCGIVGILGKTPAVSVLLEALKSLEYRGYDSSGIATLERVEGSIALVRAPGKLEKLLPLVAKANPVGTTGIGHIRWATHGKANEVNSHPHATPRVAVVHNGIIENFRELREGLEADGVKFVSETDTETITQLVDQKLLKQISPVEAVRGTLAELQGTFAIIFLFAGEEDLLIAAKRGSPLAIGIGDGEMFVGSDAIALAPLTKAAIYLEEDDMAVLTHTSATIYNKQNVEVKRTAVAIPAQHRNLGKAGFKHYMRKEIGDQADVVARTLSHYIDFNTMKVGRLFDIELKGVEHVTIVACGTAFYAGEVAKYWFETLAGVPTTVDIASEFRYREPPFPRNNIVVVVSQSGETADTLASLRYAKSKGQTVIGIVNVEQSTIAREVESCFPTLAGPEISVASTKAFVCQLAVFAAMALRLGSLRGVLSREAEKEAVLELLRLPRLMSEVLQSESAIEKLADKLQAAQVSHLLFLGRGTGFPLAKEGALKFTEITYKLGQGYAAGELKHGPIAIVDATLPVVVLAPTDGEVFRKTLSNVEEVKARHGNIILFTDQEGKNRSKVECHSTIVLPKSTFLTAPFLYAIPLQLLAYHLADKMGLDVDQPRNLAKSVTVE